MEFDLRTIIGKSLLHDFPSQYIVPDVDCLPDYQHFTFSVRSVSEYLDVIKLLTSLEYDSPDSDIIVFRGMSDYSWDLMPSIARLDLRDESTEHEMVYEFMTLRPEAFQGLHSNFELLAKMQHYGLPTRLLDFTTNPLIALYFACEENSNKNARVVCCNTCFSYNDNKIVEAISSSYLPYALDDLKLEDLLQGTRVSAYEYINRLYLVKDYRPLFAKPKYWNQRIKNQSAIFLIYPNELVDSLGKTCYYQKFYGLENTIMGMEDTEENRQRILEVSARESLESVYPIDIPHKSWHNDNVVMRDFTVTSQSMKHLFSNYEKDVVRIFDTDRVASYTDYGAVLFERRFSIEDEIEKIDPESLENQFCSIIIEAKYKCCILKELECIGIDKAFVYPELEYTAEKIKKKYL